MHYRFFMNYLEITSICFITNFLIILILIVFFKQLVICILKADLNYPLLPNLIELLNFIIIYYQQNFFVFIEAAGFYKLTIILITIISRFFMFMKVFSLVAFVSFSNSFIDLILLDSMVQPIASICLKVFPF